MFTESREDTAITVPTQIGSFTGSITAFIINNLRSKQLQDHLWGTDAKCKVFQTRFLFREKVAFISNLQTDSYDISPDFVNNSDVFRQTKGQSRF